MRKWGGNESRRREQEVIKGVRAGQAPPVSQVLILAKNSESWVLQRQQLCFPDRTVGEQKTTPVQSPWHLPSEGEDVSPARPTSLSNLLFDSENIAEWSASTPPSLLGWRRMDGQATLRCSVLGPGLSAHAGKAGAGLVLVQSDQRESFLLSLGFTVSTDILPVSGDLCMPGRDASGGGLFGGGNS